MDDSGTKEKAVQAFLSANIFLKYLCFKYATKLLLLHCSESLGLHKTRSCNNLYLKRPAINVYHKSFQYQGAFEWNHFPKNMTNICSEVTFKNYAKNFNLANR